MQMFKRGKRRKYKINDWAECVMSAFIWSVSFIHVCVCACVIMCFIGRKKNLPLGAAILIPSSSISVPVESAHKNIPQQHYQQIVFSFYESDMEYNGRVIQSVRLIKKPKWKKKHIFELFSLSFLASAWLALIAGVIVQFALTVSFGSWCQFLFLPASLPKRFQGGSKADPKRIQSGFGPLTRYFPFALKLHPIHPTGEFSG